MNELATSTSNILNAIEPALTKLSETFCVSVDFIKANAIQYVMMYGKYQLSNEIVCNMGISIFIGLIIGIIYMLAVCENGMYIKKIVLWFLIPTLIIFIIMSVMTIIPYIVSPEMYSINQVIQLIK